MFKQFFSPDPQLLRLGRYLIPYRGTVACAVGFMTLAGASSSLIALLLGKLTDLGFYQQQAWVVLAAPLGLVGVAVLHGTSMFMSNYLLGKASQGILRTLRAQIFHRMLRWPQATYAAYPTGFVASKFVFSANFALTNAAKSAITLIRDTVQVAALSVMLFWHNWTLALLSLLMAPGVAWLLKFVSRRMKGIIASSQTNISELLVRIKEVYRAERSVKMANAYERECERFARVNNEIRDVVVRMSKISALGSPLTQLLCMAAVAVVFTAAMYQTQQGLLTVGELVMFLAALLLILPPLRHLAGLNASFVMMGVAADSIFTLLDLSPEPDSGTKTLTRCQGAVTFEHVSLRYSGADKDAVHDVSLAVAPGEVVALVGASGAGKSSLVSLLPRFWNPTSGRVLVDGVDTQELTLANLRSQIAVVSQDVTLFNDTIRANIKYSAPDASDEAVDAAVRAAALEEFVASLPQGLDTPVGEAGDLLSGGQRQRLAVARAFVKNAPILILDEATSALDSVSEARIKAALTHLMQGRTTFIVAHRFSTVENADRIVAMENGAVVEVGTKDELLARQGLFARLYALQRLPSVGGEP